MSKAAVEVNLAIAKKANNKADIKYYQAELDKLNEPKEQENG